MKLSRYDRKNNKELIWFLLIRGFETTKRSGSITLWKKKKSEVNSETSL